MIKPCQANRELLNDIRAQLDELDALNVWWLGQSGFLVQWHQRHLLFDPYLSDSLTRKYADTDKPHVRMTELVIAPEQLDFVDVVTSSHNHTDHLDAETLLPLRRVNPQIEILVPAANREFAADRLQIPPERLVVVDAGDSIQIGEFCFHAVPAAHESVDLDEQGRCRFLGYVVQFGEWTVYHSGDTMLHDGLVETLRSWSIDLALLPINGARPERRVAGNLWGREAAQLAHDAGIRHVIPCHYEMFEFNTESPDEFVETCSRLGQSYKVLRAGERFRLAGSAHARGSNS